MLFSKQYNKPSANSILEVILGKIKTLQWSFKKQTKTKQNNKTKKQKQKKQNKKNKKTITKNKNKQNQTKNTHIKQNTINICRVLAL